MKYKIGDLLVKIRGGSLKTMWIVVKRGELSGKILYDLKCVKSPYVSHLTYYVEGEVWKDVHEVIVDRFFYEVN